MRTVSIIGLDRFAFLGPGDDVAQAIFDALKLENLEIVDDDVVVISQKVVSKAERLEVDISSLKPNLKAQALSRKTGKDPRLIALILKDTRKILRADRQAFIVQRKDGNICLNGGVDKSNVKGRLRYSRLPLRSDLSAAKIRARLEELSGRKLSVIVADTYSRPFRAGQVEFAIGISGFEPVVDYRGQKDLFGYELRYKFVGLADEVAAAAELVIGQGTERTPVAIVRGLARLLKSEDDTLSRKLLIGQRRDLFHGIV